MEPTGAVVGVDLGIKELAVTSDGIKYANQKFTYEENEYCEYRRQEGADFSEEDRDAGDCYG